ncbi:MAG: alkaline phosphatase family protein [Gammaproteobacteria bacterium]
MINHDLTLTRPAYDGGSIANLMASLGAALGAPPTPYRPLTSLPDERLGAARRIALVVIDGLGAELLSHLAPGGALAAYSHGTMTSVFPPTTASAVTTFMSGLAPQQHGLTGWFMHFRKLGAVTAVLPFVPRFSRHALGTSNIEPGALIDAPSFAARIARPSAMLLPRDLADSAFSCLLGAGARRDGYAGLEDFAARLAAFVRGDDEAAYLYAYWPELDRLAHLHGPSSAAVATHFAALETVLDGIMRQAAASGTLVIVTADHGFIDSGADERIELDAHPEIAAMLALPLCGEPRAAYAYVRASAADDFEACVTAELSDALSLHRSQDFIAEGWYGHGPVHPELAARTGDYVLCLRERLTLRDSVVGERPFNLRGQHGGTSAAEQYVPLLVAGP